jgi:hypothetical protein
MKTSTDQGFQHVSIWADRFHWNHLWHGDVITVPCALGRYVEFTGKVDTANIALAVEYRPILIPAFMARTPWVKQFHFIAVRQADGTLRWLRQTPNW